MSSTPSCQFCQKAQRQRFSGTYSMACPECRTRLVNKEECKKMRATLVEFMRKRWSDTDNWKGEPHCGCKYRCAKAYNKAVADGTVGNSFLIT